MNPAALTGSRNLLVSWWLIALSLLGGMMAGLWSFNGPVPAPPGWEAYDALPRRLMRLAHIAAIMLPILNFHYVAWIGRTRWGARTRAAGLRLLLLGTVGLPAALAGAALWEPAKYALSLPAVAVTAAVLLLAAGLVAPKKAAAAPRHPEAEPEDAAALRRARVALPPAPV